MKPQPDPTKFLRFACVGAAVFGLDFALLWVLQKFLWPLAAVSTAYLLAVTTHFCLNKWWVFRERRGLCLPQVGRYGLMVLLCWVATVGIVAGGLQLGANVYLAKLMAIPPVTGLGYVLMRCMVFRATAA